MNPPVTIHAIERGRAPSNLPRSTRILETAHFDVVVAPTIPIHVGQRVQIHSLTPKSTPASLESGRRAQNWYTSTPTDIAGRVVGVRTMELAVTEFIVLNEEHQSLVEYAYLTVQHVEGVTVAMEAWRRLVRTALLPILPHTRHVPTVKDAVITPVERM